MSDEAMSNNPEGNGVPSSAPSPAPPRWRWVAVAAAVLAVVLITVLAINQVDSDEVTAPGTNSSSADSTTPGGGLPAPADGFRWVSSRDVAVQVPVEWGFMLAPPFTGSLPSTLIGCDGLRQSDDVLHLQLLWDHGLDQVPSWHHDRQLGNTIVTVAVPSGSAEDQALAETIVASAISVSEDQNACAATSPVQQWAWQRPTKAFDVASLTGLESVSLRQYVKASDQESDAQALCNPEGQVVLPTASPTR